MLTSFPLWVWVSSLGCGFLAIAIALRQYFHASRVAEAERFVHMCRTVVNFSFHGLNTDLEQRLALRARPNSRLVRVFGIRNSLTTQDVELHRRFLGEATNRLQAMKPKHWADLFLCAQRWVLDKGLHVSSSLDGRGGGNWRFAPIVRYLCFCAAADAIFGPGTADGLPCGDVEIATDEINRLWIESKDPDALPDSHVLMAVLDKMNLRGLHFGREALALIIPAYETLWRVVLLTYVHAYQMSGSSERDNLRRISDVPECLGKLAERAALQIAKEGLRLYPSTKRIYRAESISDDSTHPTVTVTTIAADVERCHRNPVIWGPDPLAFRPERFDNLTELQREAYFPFGLRPHRCPAFGGFGDRLVTLLVAVLATTLGGHDEDTSMVEHGNNHDDDVVLRRRKWNLFSDEQSRHAVKEPLPTGRMDMESWTIQKGHSH